MENKYMNIPKEKFSFVQRGDKMHDEKFKTKSRGYFADAFLRFKKNKSSVVAACIIGFLVLFSIVSPIISHYTIKDKDKMYVNYAPYTEGFSDLGIGILDGGVIYQSYSENQLKYLEGIAQETGRDPLIKILDTFEEQEMKRGQIVTKTYHKIRVNKYFEKGIMYMVFSEAEYDDIIRFEQETGIRVIYPYVAPENLAADNLSKDKKDTLTRFYKDNLNPNLWYKVTDDKGTPALDADGNFIHAYHLNPKSTTIPGKEYTGIRVEGDDGTFIYSAQKGSALQCRIDYYSYYQYKNGHAPQYIFGTNNMGQDIFCAIGIGARFSLIFAICVSAINLTIGAIYGAIQGFYGGYVDLTMDRISDILSGVPSMITVSLFQLHLAQKVGVIPSFLFAFVLTGWIGMAALTRKQFYRFKSQEYIMAAKTLGASDWRLMFKHIFPNSLGTIVTSCVLVIPGVISSETTLTYLGIVNLQSFAGTSIGVLMSQGQTSMTTSPHAMFFPAMFVSLLLISFNLFGNGLRDAFNPSTRGVDD